MATVVSNSVKECDPKTLLKSIHGDLDAGAWWKFIGQIFATDGLGMPVYHICLG